MPEYQFAEVDGSIVNIEYDRSGYFSSEQVLVSLKKAFELFPFEVEIAKEDCYDDVFHVTYTNDNPGFADIYICAKGTTPGGRSGLKDEQRIQPKAKYLNYVYDKGVSGKKALFLGVYSRNDQIVLCTWKVTASAAGALETSISKQIKITSIAKAIKEGFAQQDKGKGEYACAFKPEFLYFYLKNSDWLHNGPVSELPDHIVSESEDLYGKIEDFTPEWFKTKAEELVGFDEKIEPLYAEFQEKFAPKKLAELNGKDVLSNIFLNPYNKENMCRIMEYNNDNRLYFGSIKSGTSFKYGLFYSPKENSWVSGTSQNPEYIDEETAIVIGTEIRNYFLAGISLILKK